MLLVVGVVGCVGVASVGVVGCMLLVVCCWLCVVGCC